MSKRAWIIIGIVVVVLFFIYQGLVGPYNNMVKMSQEVKGQWGNVEVAYQRRADLIPNLVETVKGYANFEKSTLTEIAGLRASVGQAKINWDNKSLPIGDRINAANSMESSLSRLLVVVERYPDLKANQNFMALQAELSGTENRISVERRKYNDAVKDFNAYILTFPNNMIRGIGNFNEMPYFQSDKGSEKAPSVKF
jgi:LemA protein